MTRAFLLTAASALLCVALACGDDDGAEDTGVDGATVDSGGADTATDTATADTGGTDSGNDDGGSPGRVAAFIAQGHAGRTTLSCDAGRTWIANRSLDDSAVCWPEVGEYDCDHHPGAAKGITYGRGYFFATWGWGSPGGIDRSTDGVTWERVVTDTAYGGIAFGADVVLAASRNAQRSVSDGVSWENTGDTMLEVFNVRRAGFAEGTFVMVGEDGGDRDVVVSADDGATWSVPTIPAECGSGVQTRGGIVGGNGTILIVGGDGIACTSTDGSTFVQSAIGTDISSQVVWTGAQFATWSRGQAHTSPDGVTWSSADTTPGDLNLGAVAYDPESGTYVGVRGGWQVWYDSQVFYRSTDGVTWTEADSFTGSHPIRFIEFGYLDASSCAG